MTEWYIHGEQGLEQGLTINERPTAVSGVEDSMPLRIEFTVTTTLQLQNPGQSGSLQFASADGSSVLTYDQLSVKDARGRELTAWFSAADSSKFAITINDSNALYPIVIDPTVSVRLVKDINLENGGSSPQRFAKVNGLLFFSAQDLEHGYELWKSDGTAAGTVLVKDIHPGTTLATYGPDCLTAVGGTLFFAEYTSETGWELWKSDGTAAGTVLVKDIYPGTSGSAPIDLVAVGQTLFFRAIHPATGDELWRSDGTDAGTVLVKDINSGGASSSPTRMTLLGEILFFQAYHPATGYELWKSDGTEAGTVLIKDINIGGGRSYPSYLTVLGEILFFSAYRPDLGYELWKSDGTEAGTVLVKDINPGSDSSFPEYLTVVGETLYFSAEEPTTGRELWRSDGTEAGTVLVRDILPGNNSSNPAEAKAVGNLLFFAAYDPVTGGQLWKSDGTAAGTVLVKDRINPACSSGIVVGETLFFSAIEPTTGRELWKSDGTTAGTVLVQDIFPGAEGSSPSSFIKVGDTLFFFADSPLTGNELWALDLNSPPLVTIQAPPSGLVQPANADVLLSATISDPDAADTHTGVWIFTSAAGEVRLDAMINGSQILQTVRFTVPGVYTITLEVTDNHGHTAMTNIVGDLPAYVVIFNASNGFVTGGGWIWSPAGAIYPGDPQFAPLEGKANFGFVAKYQKGANIPAGNTEFQLKAGDLNFKSKSYDWLVVAGRSAKYKGSGTINGSGDYAFMVTAIDGDLQGGGGVDRFRIKIWGKATGRIVYDNQPGADDTSEASTALGGGSIVIHK